MKTILRFFVLPVTVFSLVILLNSCVFSSSNDGAPGAQLLTDENKKKIEAVIDKYVDEVKSPAALAGIWTPGGEQVVVRGKSDVKTGTAALATDRFRIASLTKTFTATLLLMLVEDKKIGLEDKLSKFYPGVKNADKITIRQVINHTSGIFSYTAIKEFNDLSITDPLKKWTYDDLLALVAAKDPYCEPGQGFNYSNTNYMIMGMLIEKLSGKKYDEFLQEKICAPLGLISTYYATTPEIAGNFYHGYRDSVDVSLLDPSGPNAAGAIISTLQDLKIWNEALAEGKLLSKAMQEERMKFVVNEKNPSGGYGLGIIAKGSFLGHTGGISGFNLDMFYHPGMKTSIIIMFPLDPSNAKAAPDRALADIAEILLPGEISRPVTASQTVK